MKWLKNIADNFFKQLIVILIGFTIVIGMVFVGLKVYTDNLSGSMRAEPKQHFTVQYVEGKAYLMDNDKKSKIAVEKRIYKSIAFERIISQMNEIRRRSKSHDKTMIFFYQQQYIFNLMQAFMILITTIFMLIVSKYGWDNVDRILLLAFFVCGGFVAFFNVIPQSLKIKENIHNNKEYVITYENAENSIVTYLSTGESEEGKIIDPKKYVHMLDRELKEHNNISFDLDDIPDQNFQFDKQ